MQIIDADHVLDRLDSARNALLPRCVPERPCVPPGRLCRALHPKPIASCGQAARRRCLASRSPGSSVAGGAGSKHTFTFSRCLSGSSYIDQREAGHQQRQDRHGSTNGHPIFGPLMAFLMISMLPTQLRASAACHPFPGSSFARRANVGGRNLEAAETYVRLRCPEPADESDRPAAWRFAMRPTSQP